MISGKMWKLLAGLGFALAIITQVAGQGVVTGYLDDSAPEDAHPVSLEVGQRIVVKTEAISGDLDTVIRLESPSGEVLAENDDVDGSTVNSFISLIAEEAGKYTVYITNYPGTAGEYVMSIAVSDGGIVAAARLSAEVHTGFMGDLVPDAEFPVTLQPGQAVVVIAEGQGELDTYLFLLAENGDIISENDDRTYSELDSEIVYISEDGGDYTVVLSNYPESAGEYELSISVVPADQIPMVLRYVFSGPPQYFDTEHFRIHYTLEGLDATSEAYVQEVGRVMEEVRAIQNGQFGWPEPLPDGLVGGDERFDVYIVDLITDELGGDLGVSVTEPIYPETGSSSGDDVIVSSSFILLDNDYDLFGQSPEGILRATAAHEYHHTIQFSYDAAEPFRWYLEATAAWMETQTYPTEQDATGYVVDLFTYPEVCFGAEIDADPTEGLLAYGYWLFIQSLADAHGLEIMPELWANIGTGDQWEPLERTLSTYDDDLPSAVRRFHMQNLARDYDLAPAFANDVVWQENLIDEPGRWSFRGRGIQELGANYYGLELAPGAYEANLIDDDGHLQLFMIGIAGGTANVFELGRGGIIEPGTYEYAYLMVFNPEYDDDTSDCDYDSYRIAITESSDKMAKVKYTFDARYFKSLD